MSNHKIVIVAVSLLASTGVLACAGGGGEADDVGSWEPASHTGERAGSSQERAGSSQERAAISTEGAAVSTDPAPNGHGTRSPGGGGGGGDEEFSCSGSYRCQSVGDDDSMNVTLSADGEGCRASGGGVSLTLGPNGTISREGQTVGSWSSSGRTVSITVQSDDGPLVITCTKRR